jgi:glutamine amidotransferase
LFCWQCKSAKLYYKFLLFDGHIYIGSNQGMLVVIDYNVGNVKSVCNAFRYIGCEVELSRDHKKIENAAGLVLPGVAAFGFAVKALGNLDSVIRDLALAGKPLLGICVGYQMLFEESCEYGTHKGLGLVSGKVVPVPPGRVVPHMGWNKVELPADMTLFADLDGAKHFYFANSFYADVADNQAKIAYADYGFRMPVSIQKGNIFGTQFHPEKSSNQGLQVLRNFARIAEEGKS